jgi:hypothetical protein
MTRRLALLVAALFAAAGCHMCSDCCDYSSPVANSPYAGTGGRAGSNSGVMGPMAYESYGTAEAAPVTLPPAEFVP